jgi:hypothetical protein
LVKREQRIIRLCFIPDAVPEAGFNYSECGVKKPGVRFGIVLSSLDEHCRVKQKSSTAKHLEARYFIYKMLFISTKTLSSLSSLIIPRT